jgi:hypothetical protein
MDSTKFRGLGPIRQGSFARHNRLRRNFGLFVRERALRRHVLLHLDLLDGETLNLDLKHEMRS